MKPWVALPTPDIDSKVTFSRIESMSPDASQSIAFRSKTGSGPVSPNCRGPPSSSDRCPLPIAAMRLSDGYSSMMERIARPRSQNRFGLGSGVRRCSCRSVPPAGPPRPRGDNRADDRVVDLELVADREVEASVKQALEHEPRQVLVSVEQVLRDRELPLLVVVRRVVLRGLADDERRVVVGEELVEVIGSDHDQDLGVSGEGLPVRLDLLFPLGRLRDAFLGRCQLGGLEEERVVRRCEHRGEFGHWLLR